MLRRVVPLFALAFGITGSSPIEHAPTAPPPVPREFRAAWATPIWERGFKDWPSNPNMTPAEQRAEGGPTAAFKRGGRGRCQAAPARKRTVGGCRRATGPRGQD